MLDIIIYIFVGLCFGFLIGLFLAAVLLDRRTKKIKKKLNDLYGCRGMGKTAHLGNITPVCYLDTDDFGEDKQ